MISLRQGDILCSEDGEVAVDHREEFEACREDGAAVMQFAESPAGPGRGTGS